MASVSGLKPNRDKDSVILVKAGVKNLASSIIGSGARAMLVLTTGRNAGGERRGDGATHVSGGVPGDGPGTAVCYGHCWNNGNTRLVKQ